MSQVVKYVLFALLIVTVNISCDGMFSTPIGKIVENPREHADRTLTISGEVVEVYGFLFVKYFVLRDESGEIPVVSNKPLPKKGTEVKVTGTVKEAFSLGDRQLLVFVESTESKN